MADNQISSSYDGLHMPYSPEAEQALLGAIILESDVFDKVIEYIKSPDYFYVSLHKLIFKTMTEMVNFGGKIDFVTLLEKLKQTGSFDETTGKTYLYDLVNNCPSISNAEAYAEVIRDKYNIRRLITAAREIIEDATAGTEDTSVIIDSAEQKIFDIRQGNEKKGLERINSVIMQTFDRLLKIERSRVNGDRVHRLPGNVNMCFEGIEGESLLLRLDMNGISASSGSACTSGSLDPSHVLLAIGLPHEIAHGSMRLSFSAELTDEDVDYMLEVIPQVVTYLRNMSPLWEKIKKQEAQEALNK